MFGFDVVGRTALCSLMVSFLVRCVVDVEVSVEKKALCIGRFRAVKTVDFFNRSLVCLLGAVSWFAERAFGSSSA